MTGDSSPTKPFNVRLPMWAVEYIDERAGERGITKTQVVVEALAMLRAQELQDLMRMGYEEMRAQDQCLATEMFPILWRRAQG